MKINLIAATNYACKKPKMQSFNGSWEEKQSINRMDITLIIKKPTCQIKVNLQQKLQKPGKKKQDCFLLIG